MALIFEYVQANISIYHWVSKRNNIRVTEIFDCKEQRSVILYKVKYNLYYLTSKLILFLTSIQSKLFLILTSNIEKHTLEYYLCRSEQYQDVYNFFDKNRHLSRE